MNTYLIFINGIFETTEDIDEFSVEFMELFKTTNSAKFVIENQYNMIIIFNSDEEEEEIAKKIKTKLISEHIRFYFLFNREDIMVANMPQEISSLIFKNLPIDSSLEINLYNKEELTSDDENEEPIINGELYMDAILDKIEKFGIESLTDKEKKFLDSFNN